jgi:diguanylate cyclase (GGDEF)-like protein
MTGPVQGIGADSAAERMTIDPLTGLRNEQLFRLRFPEELRLARDREANAALLLIKIDNIIAVNNQYGRSGGDEALRAVGQVLEAKRAASDRGEHLAARLGGPLFAYYAPICSSPEARASAEEILSVLREPGLYLAPLDVSIGVVNLYEFFLDEGTDRQITERIEQAALARVAFAEALGSNTVCDSVEVGTTSTTQRASVLIVDPELAALQMLSAALEAGDVNVRVCADGETALTLIQAEAPQVVIAEAMCPRIDGFALRERLRSNALWADIPFILISHKKNENLIRRAVTLDIRYYFRKPLSVAEVAGLAGNLIRTVWRPGQDARRRAVLA